MSTTYSVFIKKSEYSEVKDALEQVLGSSLVKDSSISDVSRIGILGLEISLIKAVDFVDDRNLKLSQYDYYIVVDYFPRAFDIDYAHKWMEMTALILGNMMSNALNCECIVVKNVQVLIRKFIPKNAS